MVNTIPQLSTRDDVRQVLVVTLALNVTVAICKIIIGIWSGVLSVSADGVHSLVDASSNVIALFAHRIAQRPADADHPYGHRRFETVAALGIGAFLLLTAFELISVAFDRLRQGGEAPVISPITFVVMIGTLVVNLFVTTYEMRAAQRFKSALLAADAAHTRSDVFVTISVLVSMVLVVLFRWAWADIVTTIVIVGFILHAAWEVISKTGRVLVDAAPFSSEELTKWVEALPSVEHVVRARSRGSIDAAQVDIDVQVAPEMTAAQTQAIADSIREELAKRIYGLTEVEVHFVPNADRPADYAMLARARADALGLATHEVYVRDGSEGKVMELHVEVPPGQTLGMAHEQVSQLEADIQSRLPEVEEVITHIEPAILEKTASDFEQQSAAETFRKQVKKLLNAHFPQADWHNIEAFPTVSGFTLAMHVTLPAQISLEAAHQIAESAEVLLRAHLPLVERVTIHTEPPD